MTVAAITKFEKRNMTVNDIFNGTLNKYCDFVPRYTMENNLLFIIHCVNVLCVRLKNRKY